MKFNAPGCVVLNDTARGYCPFNVDKFDVPISLVLATKPKYKVIPRIEIIADIVTRPTLLCCTVVSITSSPFNRLLRMKILSTSLS